MPLDDCLLFDKTKADPGMIGTYWGLPEVQR